MLIPVVTLLNDEGFVYLVKNKDHTMFKIGWSQNIQKRMRSYVSHYPDIDLIKAWHVPSKDFENKIRKRIIDDKLGMPCKIKAQKEWLYGNPLVMEMEFIIEKIKEENFAK